ncbi:MAG: hypothetical protein GYA17_15705 [Chloroflexi bacterium]|nr:hypothetical protein [Chloroflexota bacterium]
MNLLRQMSFAPFDHQPGNRQGPFAIQQTDHQGDAPTPDFAAIDDKYQFTDRDKMRQQLPHERQVMALIRYSLILHLATIALDAAIRLGRIRRFAGNQSRAIGSFVLAQSRLPAPPGWSACELDGLSAGSDTIVSLPFWYDILDDCPRVHSLFFLGRKKHCVPYGSRHLLKCPVFKSVFEICSVGY